MGDGNGGCGDVLHVFAFLIVSTTLSVVLVDAPTGTAPCCLYNVLYREHLKIYFAHRLSMEKFVPVEKDNKGP